MSIVVLFVALAAAAAGQEFELIAAAHRDLGAFELHIDVRIKAGDSMVPLQAVVKCDGQQRCLRTFQNSVTLQTPKLSLMVDTGARTITVTRHQELLGRPSGSMDPAAALTNWSEQGGQLSGGEITPDGRRWTFSSRPGVSSGDMYTDAVSRRLRRLVYRSESPAGPSTVDIRYEWGDPALLDAREFRADRFVEERRGVFVAVRDYAKYRVIDADRR